jgi:predicted Zn-dependent protease with MMP-like domain
MTAALWNKILDWAEFEVGRTLKKLPPDLRARAAGLPITYERTPNDALVEDDIAPDTLGLFVGNAYPDPSDSQECIPPQIILFLENLWDCAEGDELDFRKEVRRTYLHELGHYLGLEEDDLEERGLE